MKTETTTQQKLIIRNTENSKIHNTNINNHKYKTKNNTYNQHHAHNKHK